MRPAPGRPNGSAPRRASRLVGRQANRQSGRAESNRRPPAPKAGALTKLRYAPSGRDAFFHPSTPQRLDNRLPPKVHPPASAAQRFHNALEVVVRLEGQHNLTLVLALDPDVYLHRELLT